jgi:hypothetical protein
VRVRDRASVLLATTLAVVVVACGRPSNDGAEQAGQPADGPATAFQAAPSVPPSPPPLPTGGNGSYATAPGSGPVVGTGSRRIRYRVEVETGIAWGGNIVWTPADFAKRVDEIIAAPLGWTMSAQFPVTNADVRLANASWSFQRVDGSAFEVRVRLATPATVEQQCAANGVDTAGVFSCRFGQTLMINLARWLNGADGYPVSPDDYRTAVINHEMGHFLGFDHMKCPGRGMPGPIMMTQTISLDGCEPNVHPFTPAGQFPTGPWIPS